MHFHFSHLTSSTYSWPQGTLWKLLVSQWGREQLLFLALWFFLLELSEQCVFCVRANNKGAFWLTSGQLASTSAGSTTDSGSLNVYCMHQFFGPRVCQCELHGLWTSDNLLSQLIPLSTTLSESSAWGESGLWVRIEGGVLRKKCLWGSAACWEVPRIISCEMEMMVIVIIMYYWEEASGMVAVKQL